FETSLLHYAEERVSQIPQVKIIGRAVHKTGALSMIVEGAHPYDVGVLLDKMGVAVRTGHHCTEPVMNYFCIPGTLRASFAVYNTTEEVDRFAEYLEKAIAMVV